MIKIRDAKSKYFKNRENMFNFLSFFVYIFFCAYRFAYYDVELDFYSMEYGFDK